MIHGFVGVADASGRAVFLDMVPGCGCDACDSGSAELLETLDGWAQTVARGGVVHARGADGHITRTLTGWTAQGDGLRTGWQADQWLEESRGRPHGVQRWIGAPWL